MRAPVQDTEATGAAVIVIGGGVTGLSAAWWLARQGVAVLVLERGIVGWEASGRNGGGCTHYASPLFREEQHLWPQMDALLGYPTEHRPYRIGVAMDEMGLKRFRRMAEIAAEDGFSATMLDPKALREAAPLVTEAAAGGVFFDFGGHANPQRTVQAYAWALEDLGGRILQHTTLTGFQRRGGKVTAVETDRGVFGCDTLVVAAGPGTGPLLGRLGAHLPMAPARAEMIVTEPLPPMRHGGVDGNGLYGRQTLRGNLAYGGGPHEWLAEEPPPDRPGTPLLRNLAHRVATLFPRAAHARVIRSWAGVIENTPDGRPVLDVLEDPPNVVAATMSSVGFGLSPASGRAIADLALHGSCQFADLSSLRLDRFKNVPLDWRERRGWVPPVPPDAGETAQHMGEFA
ncbi:sarcosine oxidase subunit beta [Humitalea rosea]|uniref:Sarcosine oxidase subunit beta n=1 Tax=Humitalea rosea TaxID=990373 RepID=A0A2W7IIW8_9PROT|nr:FAD-binding oxidoreductase [Humitalea rosea]PZW39287.1 sarcosine oxidase subunit beta [Humitalea rosea]